MPEPLSKREGVKEGKEEVDKVLPFPSRPTPPALGVAQEYGEVEDV